MDQRIYMQGLIPHSVVMRKDSYRDHIVPTGVDRIIKKKNNPDDLIKVDNKKDIKLEEL